MSDKPKIFVRNANELNKLNFELKRLDKALWWSEYVKYLASPEWLAKRDTVMARDMDKCRACGKKAIQVHHLSYARLYNESEYDLVSLCDACHDLVSSDVEIRQGVKADSVVPIVRKIQRYIKKLSADAADIRQRMWRKPRKATGGAPSQAGRRLDLLGEIKKRKE